MTKIFTEYNIISEPRLRPVLDAGGLPELEALLDLLVEDRPHLPHVADGPGLDPVADLEGGGRV